jgi:transcriptional regulator with XRE-family HTH domain
VTPDFTERLRQEFARRRATNPRYSLRAFARFLGLEHSTLSQIFRGRRAMPAGTLTSLAVKLRLGAEETVAYLGACALGDAERLAAQVSQMSWLAEAAALMRTSAHWQLLALIESAEWRPDMRWAAAKTGRTIDELNEAMSRLLRLGLIQVDSGGRWRVDREIAGRDAGAQREIALERARASMSRPGLAGESSRG